MEWNRRQQVLLDNGMSRLPRFATCIGLGLSRLRVCEGVFYCSDALTDVPVTSAGHEQCQSGWARIIGGRNDVHASPWLKEVDK